MLFAILKRNMYDFKDTLKLRNKLHTKIIKNVVKLITIRMNLFDLKNQIKQFTIHSTSNSLRKNKYQEDKIIYGYDAVVRGLINIISTIF